MLENFDIQLQSFFDQWEKIPRHPSKAEHKNELFPSASQLSIFFKNFEKEYQRIIEFRKQGLYTNVWQTSGLKKDEVRNSQVLKWFLDCNADHGLENLVLDILLKNTSIKCSTPEKYYSYTETYPINDGKNRVDIEIESPELLLFIEVKIEASEGFEQLKRYQEIAEKKAKGKQWAIIYLTQNGKLPPNYSKSEYLNPLSWARFSSAILQHTQKFNKQTHNIWLLSQFAEHLKTF